MREHVATAEVLAGLAVAASRRYVPHRAAPSDVAGGPVAVEVGAEHIAGAPAHLGPVTPVDAADPRPASAGVHVVWGAR